MNYPQSRLSKRREGQYPLIVNCFCALALFVDYRLPALGCLKVLPSLLVSPEVHSIERACIEAVLARAFLSGTQGLRPAV